MARLVRARSLLAKRHAKGYTGPVGVPVPLVERLEEQCPNQSNKKQPGEQC